MKKGTEAVEKTTSALVRLLLRPKPYFLEEEKQADKLKEPSILVINHTSHLDGPIVNTVFRKDPSIISQQRTGSNKEDSDSSCVIPDVSPSIVRIRIFRGYMSH